MQNGDNPKGRFHLGIIPFHSINSQILLTLSLSFIHEAVNKCLLCLVYVGYFFSYFHNFLPLVCEKSLSL
ncbi:MAG: hypothetical protein BAJALOKI1v1_210006 [Promethearchaeota archaeon]|nr:MAG: hypothetical protein BAJALOKI1v1_210006 [Candidatus Lokiarchaeota archaeon]